MANVGDNASTRLEDVLLIPQSISDINWEEIDLKTSFLNKTLSLPIIINAITGGTKRVARINAKLAKIAKNYNIPMAVGSQTIALEIPELADTFTIARQENPAGVIIANISAFTKSDSMLKAIDMIEADAIQIHFNIPQELAMLEGDRNFKGVIKNVRELVDNSPVPVIAKEVGFGFSKEAIELLYNAGVRFFDISGAGGTNFIAIEDARQGMFAGSFNSWGIPTAWSLVEALSLEIPICVISSGGIRTALDITKSLALGANYVGMANWFLQLVLNNTDEEVANKLDNLIYCLKASLLMCGAKNIFELQKKPVIILGQTKDYLQARGIDTSLWSARN